MAVGLVGILGLHAVHHAPAAQEREQGTFTEEEAKLVKALDWKWQSVKNNHVQESEVTE